MPIEFKCETCSKLLRVPDGSGGKQCQCPGCSALLSIPLIRADAAAKSTSAQSGGTDIALCIPCPKCRHELICDPRLLGTKGQCRSCKHIFVIRDLQANEVPSAEPIIQWVFNCPKCSQLFEGSEAMRGRRGKCHVCGEVFSIEVRADDLALAEKTNSTANSFDGDLTFAVLPSEVTSTLRPLARTRPQVRQDASFGSADSNGFRNDPSPFQFSCASCQGRMEVPGRAAGQLTHCPHCKRQMTIPSESEPMSEGLAANNPWADLNSLGSELGPTPLSDPFGDTPYQPSSIPMAPMSSGIKRRSGGQESQFITCGVFIAICAFVGIAIEIFYIVMGTMAMISAPNMGQDQFVLVSVQIVVAGLMFVLSLLQLVGGISLARRSGLHMARAGAIICCLPCVCAVLNIPFGIWGCILVFGKDAERSFR